MLKVGTTHHVLREEQDQLLEVEAVDEGSETKTRVAPAGRQEVEDQVAHGLPAYAVQAHHEPGEGDVNGAMRGKQSRDVCSEGEGVEEVEQLATSVRVVGEVPVEVGQVDPELPQVSVPSEHSVEDPVESPLRDAVGSAELPEKLELGVGGREDRLREVDAAVGVSLRQLGLHVEHGGHRLLARPRETERPAGHG